MAIKQLTPGNPPKKGGILKALLASPLVGSELDLARIREEGQQDKRLTRLDCERR